MREINFAQAGTSRIIINHYNMTKSGVPVESRKQEILTLTEDQVTPISLLFDDNKREICQYLNGVDSFNLLLASPRLFAPVNLDIVTRVDHPLRKLLSHGALGELIDAENIWRAFPHLLTCRGTVYHPNRIYVEGQAPVVILFHQNPGRYKYVDRTFYQILLMNSEFEEAEEVGKLMTQEEKQKQFNEVFPDGEIKKYNFDLEEAKRLLQVLFDAVAKDESLKIERDEDDNIKNIIMNDATQKALDKLYAYAKPKTEHDIGLVFDPEFYHEALKLYEEKCESQFKQKWDRYLFWNICVEEWLAGCLGTRFLRPHAQGLGNQLTRRGCILADGSSIFAFRRSSDSLPGFHLFVGCYGIFLVSLYRTFLWPIARDKFVFGEYVKRQRERGQVYAAICAPRSIVMSDSLK